MREPTPEESRTIRTLKRLAREWPPDLWVFAGAAISASCASEPMASG